MSASLRRPRVVAWLVTTLAVLSAAGRASADPPRPVVPARPPAPAVRPVMPPPKLVTAARAPTPAAARQPATKQVAPVVPAIALKVESGDPGITITADPTGTRVVIRGVAKGPVVKYSEDFAYVDGKRTRLVRWTEGRGVSFTLDHEKMPDFSADPDYTRKNKWYFAHLAMWDTNKGQPALTVAKGLADYLTKGGAFDCSVSETDEGAVIEIKRL